MKRLASRTIVFKDHPEFRPNLTPEEIFSQGAFGGTYWRNIKSGITGLHYKNQHHKYNFNIGKIVENLLSRTSEDISLNKYGVHSGTSLIYWEKHGWIMAQDPYGWVQWYCEFYSGRRSPDDERQIDRWLRFAGPNGRFYLRLVNLIKRRKAKWSDKTVSPTIRQGLHQWAKEIRAIDIAS